MASSYGTAASDINNDGTIDLFVANRGQADNLFRNEYFENNWIQFEAVGTESNRSAIGTRVELYKDTILQTDEILGGSGWASQNSLNLHFGLGSATEIDSVIVKWPNGLVETYLDLDINQKHILVEGSISSSVEELVKNTNELNLKVFPNPISSSTKIEYELFQNSDIQLQLVNAQGQVLKSQLIKNQPLGIHLLDWNLSKEKLAPGIYFLSLISIGQKIVKKVLVN